MTTILFWSAIDGRPVPGTLLAFDDTDAPEGMCTTYLAALIIEELSEYDLIGLPRLVRLNPNIPWKTRGNAAICLTIGHGSGPCEPCGELSRREVMCYERGSPADPQELLDRAVAVLRRVARFECDQTNPGIVASNKRPPPNIYWKAVREIVRLAEVEGVLRRTGAVWRKFKTGRGVIGAAAAMSWRPRDRTWEVIAYRSPERFGTPRQIDPRSVIRMDKTTRMTFNNYDYDNGHVAICPGSPCPILFGIRGDSAEELLRARKMIRGEPQDKWLLFLTNQATEDHIVQRRITELRPMMSARVHARVAAPPRTIVGGHVIVPIEDGASIDVAFYEPSRNFREVARQLLPGDEVVVYGSVRREPRSLNAEKLLILGLVEDRRKVRNPICASCGKSMGSLGRGKGFRCKVCGARAGVDAAEWRTVPRSVVPGWYEPPVASRRHLHKPLRRMSKEELDKI